MSMFDGWGPQPQAEPESQAPAWDAQPEPQPQAPTPEAGPVSEETQGEAEPTPEAPTPEVQETEQPTPKPKRKPRPHRPSRASSSAWNAERVGQVRAAVDRASDPRVAGAVAALAGKDASDVDQVAAFLLNRSAAPAANLLAGLRGEPNMVKRTIRAIALLDKDQAGVRAAAKLLAALAPDKADMVNGKGGMDLAEALVEAVDALDEAMLEGLK